MSLSSRKDWERERERERVGEREREWESWRETHTQWVREG